MDATYHILAVALLTLAIFNIYLKHKKSGNVSIPLGQFIKEYPMAFVLLGAAVAAQMAIVLMTVIAQHQ